VPRSRGGPHDLRSKSVAACSPLPIQEKGNPDLDEPKMWARPEPFQHVHHCTAMAGCSADYSARMLARICIGIPHLHPEWSAAAQQGHGWPLGLDERSDTHPFSEHFRKSGRLVSRTGCRRTRQEAQPATAASGQRDKPHHTGERKRERESARPHRPTGARCWIDCNLAKGAAPPRGLSSGPETIRGARPKFPLRRRRKGAEAGIQDHSGRDADPSQEQPNLARGPD